MRRLFALALLLTACTATPQSRFFLLQPLADGALAAEGAPAETPASHAPVIDLHAVNVPDLVNRPQLIESISAHECVYHEFWRWAEPLEDNIRDVLAGNLTALLAPARVLPDAGRLGIDARLQLTVDVLRFDWQPDGQAVLEARWMLVDSEQATAVPPMVWTRSVRASAKPDDPAALAGAMSQNLLELSHAIAGSLRPRIG